MPDPSADERRLYGDLAWTWPIISPPEHYEDEAEEASRIIREHASGKPRTLLHLGCGGGHLDRSLKKHFRVTGVDVSDSMLGLARSMNPEVTYLHGDMRTARLGRSFDAVTIFDSVDYMLTEGDLKTAFRTAYEHLVAGGVFVTYAEETKERFRQNHSRVSIGSKGDVSITFFENAYDPDPADTTFENTFVYLIRRPSGLEIEADRHLSGLFPYQTWLDLLGEAGFRVQQVAPRADPSSGNEVPWLVGIRPV